MQTQQILEIRTMSQEKGFTISQVAHLTGVKAKAIRYYESVGLLPRPARFANRYRRYGQADVNRLLLLRCIRSLGIPLAQAKQLLMEVSDARCIDVQQELLRLLNARLMALSQEIAELRHLQSEIEAYRQTLDSCPPGEDEQFKDCVNMSCCLGASDELVSTHIICWEMVQ
jgi:DNA-binding transcriptional MerR regulator